MTDTARHYEDELAREQAFLGEAYAALEQSTPSTGLCVGADLAASHALADRDLRRSMLVRDADDLLIGRLDFTDEDDVLRLGRHLVRDEHGEVLVCSWAAPAVQPFYTASPIAPHGVSRRRRYSSTDRQLLAFDDERLAEGGATPFPSPAAGVDGQALDRLVDLGVSGGDVLLDDLRRARAPHLRDIVATIQRDQYELLAEPGRGVLVVQGGPGSGKTVVGLHRAAYLLYNDDSVRRAGVLVLGPSRTFMDYVSRLLPSLTEDSVDHRSVDRLAGAVPRFTDKPERDQLLGDLRWVQLLTRALDDSRRIVGKPIVVPMPGHTVTVQPPELLGLVRQVERTAKTYNRGARALKDLLAQLVADRFHDEVGHVQSGRLDAKAAAAASKPVQAACRAAWPEVRPERVLVGLLADLGRLVRLGKDLFTDDELLLLYRPHRPLPDDRWTAGELVLLDELRCLIEAAPRTYGHVVLDEAQELLPMAMRMVGRRVRQGGGVTVLGDLAQAGPGREGQDWAGAVAALGGGEVRLRELTSGYRVPAEVLALASRFLHRAGTELAVPRSVRSIPDSVQLQPSDGQALADAVQTATAAALGGRRVGIVVDEACYRDVHRETVLPDGCSLTRPSTVKGLEFDVVVVVEPARFLAAGTAGARALFVALTRCTQKLVVVHAEALPGEFQDGWRAVELQDIPLPRSPAGAFTPQQAMQRLNAAISVVCQRRGLALTGDAWLEARADPDVLEEALGSLAESRDAVEAGLSMRSAHAA